MARRRGWDRETSSSSWQRHIRARMSAKDHFVSLFLRPGLIAGLLAVSLPSEEVKINGKTIAESGIKAMKLF